MRDVAYATGGVTGYPIDSPYQLARAAWANHPLKRWISAKQDATYAQPSPAQPRPLAREGDRAARHEED